MSKESPTIMVVEDETLLLQAITKKLKLSGMDVLSCASGQQAVDYLNSMDVLPDAVWLDYYLKDMNGLAFMQELKAKPEWATIPVIVVSNSASPDKVSNMLALGAKKYILKAEYRLDEIIGMIKDFISDNAPTPAVGTAAPVAAPAPGMADASAATPQPPSSTEAPATPAIAATDPAAIQVAAAAALAAPSDEPTAPAAASPVVVDSPAATAVPAETPATSLQVATPEVTPAAPAMPGATTTADDSDAAAGEGASPKPAA